MFEIVYGSSLEQVLDPDFCENEDMPLAYVFEKIYAYTEGKEAINPKSDAAALKNYFAEVLPEYDRERVHVSDIKKVFAWYNMLVSAGMTEFKLPEEEEQTEEYDQSVQKCQREALGRV